jgi:hypothetical protein
MAPHSQTHSSDDFERIDNEFFSSAPPPAAGPPVDDFADLDASAVAHASPGLLARRARVRRWALRVVATAGVATLLLAVRGAIVWVSPARPGNAATAVASPAAAIPTEPSPVAAEQTAAEPPTAIENPPVPRAAKPVAPARSFTPHTTRVFLRGRPKPPPRR